MSVFVVVALVLAVLAAAMVVVAALQLKTVVGGLADAVRRTVDRLAPLGEELAEEVAVTSTELQALGERRDTGQGGAGQGEPTPLAYTGGEG
ncbi:MAG TPA: hypothetical protein VM287_15030 [Egibacteraceae bacterium]|nr:hypothetical protein [Egibacteraceae bacterium]